MTNPRILICYSNPTNTGRLRLDLEHSSIDAAIRQAGLDPALVRRVHAATLEDLILELSCNDYELVQFSGHSDPDGIYLENALRTSHELLSAQALQRILSVH